MQNAAYPHYGESLGALLELGRLERATSDDFRLPDQGALGNLCGHLKMALARCMESQIHSSGELLSEAAHAALQTLDERLHESLAEGTIRLLSIHEWLLSQPEDWVWQNRQKLEELERSGTARPFLSREEAESALAAATRRIAVISHTRVDSMVRLLGNDSRRQIPDLTTDLAPQRDVYGSWAESS